MKIIKWFKVNCSFYERDCGKFGIKNWSDVIYFMEKHVGFDKSITKYNKPFIKFNFYER